MSVEDALNKLKAGVEIDAAFAVIVEAFKDPLFGFLEDLCHNHGDAEELVQVAFIEAFKSIRRYDPTRAGLYTWLCEIGKRQFFMVCRSRRREQAALRLYAQCGPVSAPGPDRALVLKARAEAVWKMLGRLDFYDAVVAVMHVMEGKTYERVGRELGMAARTVKMHALRARLLLRAQLLVSPVPMLPVAQEDGWTS